MVAEVEKKRLTKLQQGTHFNVARQGHGSLVSKELMYEIRWLIEFRGWKARKIEAVYKLDYRYVLLNVMQYRTMAGVVPVRSVKPVGID